MRLNLGCGRDIRNGWINLDLYEGQGVDIVHDINILPLPFEDGQFDHILCKNILEHLNYIPVIEEIHRILKGGGILSIRVPHFTSKSNYADPTHINLFSSITFNYFVKNSNDYDYERNTTYFSIIKTRICFEGFKIPILKTFYKILENGVNKSTRHQKFYERSFLRVFPALSLEILMKK